MAGALAALCKPPHPILEAADHVGAAPGLYAIYTDLAGAEAIDIPHRLDRPIYVGKAGKSFAAHDLQDHFAIDPTRRVNTGSSAVRRSFAALLRDHLELRAVPLNKERPERFAHYGLDGDGDHRLTIWMHAHLSTTTWPAPSDLDPMHLGAVEVGVIRAWIPSLNIRDNPTRLERLRTARALTSAGAASWAQLGQSRD